MSRAAAALLAGFCLASPARAEDSLDRAIAQTLLVGARGGELRPGGELERLVCGLKVGGLILFDRDVPSGGEPRNILSPEQLKRLTGRLRALARRCGAGRLLIAADVEGGLVNRLAPSLGFAPMPGHAELGSGATEQTRLAARALGLRMAELGLDWNLAPVADLALDFENPVVAAAGRAFSADPGTVAAHAGAFLAGLRSAGVLGALKHFPGHGSGKGDPHLAPVDVTETARPELELVPYRILIAEEAVDAVMTAHVLNRNLDPFFPATLSSSTLTGLLRGELGFRGLVVGEDLQMKGLTDVWTPEESAVIAAHAGVDMLLISNNREVYDPEAPWRVRAALRRAVEEGRLPLRRVLDSAARVRALKAKLK